VVAPVRAPQRAPQRPSVRPAPRPRAKPELRVVPDPTPRTRIIVVTVVGVSVLFAVLFGLVLAHTVLVQNQQRLDSLDEQVREQQAIYQRNRLEVAQLEAPARIVDVATHRLRMVPPPGTSYLVPSGTTAAAVAGPSGTSQGHDANGDAANDGAKQDQTDATGSEWSTVKPQLGAAG
jgi:cell division protein FtsL